MTDERPTAEYDSAAKGGLELSAGAAALSRPVEQLS